MTQPGLVEARIEIQDRLLSYTRGIDRLDADLVRSAFHPDAQLVDYGPNPMSIEEFAAYAISSLRERFVATQHRVSNIRVEIEGNNAVLEAYVLAYHVTEFSTRSMGGTLTNVRCEKASGKSTSGRFEKIGRRSRRSTMKWLGRGHLALEIRQIRFTLQVS